MSLSSLPTELVLHIFNSLDDISSAAALSQTSRRVHRIWRYNLDSILDAVLPRVIECYDQAHQLLETMEEPTLVASQASVEGKVAAAISRTKTLFTIADTGCWDFNFFESGINVQRKELPEQVSACTCAGTTVDHQGYHILEPSCRTRFLQGLFRALSIVRLTGRSESERMQILASMHLLDMFRMIQVLEWKILDDCMKVATQLPEFTRDLMDAYNFLRHLDTLLLDVCGVKRPRGPLRGVDPWYSLIIHGKCPKGRVDKAETLALADLLPLLPEKAMSRLGLNYWAT